MLNIFLITNDSFHGISCLSISIKKKSKYSHRFEKKRKSLLDC